MSNLQELFVLSDKMRQVIAYLFKGLNEVTPLMLQKLLYLIQGTSYALYDHTVFTEHSQAWVHGPAYPDVYHYSSSSVLILLMMIDLYSLKN